MENLTEIPITPECSELSCHCGHRFNGIQIEWTFYDERPCYLATWAQRVKANNP